MIKCKLCGGSVNKFEFMNIKDRIYYKCENCFLIFIDNSCLLDSNEEKSRYLLHNNSIEQKGYRDFLYQAIDPALSYINRSMTGLDYGCGPGPALSELLKREGFSCSNYDPVFFPNIDITQKYDYIFSTECFEHFYNPKNDIDKIYSLLKKDGILIVMTKFWNNDVVSKNWYYPLDPTHVSFYNSKTFEYISAEWNFKILHDDKTSVIILKKADN